MPTAKPNVFNIPASAPFLPALIEALRAGRLVPGFGQQRSAELGRATLICRRGAPAGWRDVP
jgi:inactivated superfamily I helicase